MSPKKPAGKFFDFAHEGLTGGRIIPRIWGRRSFWQVRLRWWVPPAILLCAWIGRLLGYEYQYLPFVLIALSILAYNALLSTLVRRTGTDLDGGFSRKRSFTILEVALDYAAVFFLVYFTGGPASPLLFFFIFHVIFAGIQFKPGTAYLFAGISVVGIWLMVLLQNEGLLPAHPIAFRGALFDFWTRQGYMTLLLFSFTATVLTTAVVTSQIMRRLRNRVKRLSEVTRELNTMNDRLSSLYAMLRTVGSERYLEPILEIVTRELAESLGVAAVGVKLLSEDEQTLRYVAHFGLPEEFIEKNIVQLAHSPLNKAVVDGRPYVIGNVTEDDTLQFPADLKEAGIRSVVFAPLRVQDRVIGILGAYCYYVDRFDTQDTSYLRLAAELVAIAIENARAYESVEQLIDERSNFMLRVAHNMRAPLAGSLSQMELLRGGYTGEMDAKQAEILSRVDRRLRVLNQSIGELLTLARSREGGMDYPPVAYSPTDLADNVESLFRAKAKAKGLNMSVSMEDGLPLMASFGDLLPQVLENLVSNAIKYTPEGGEVKIRFEHSTDGAGVRLLVEDTGIGIPAKEQSQLFTEFFRASNARALEEEGTGLGLVLVKRTVDRLGGDLKLASEVGSGTTVRLRIPPAEKNAAAGPRF